MTKMVGVTQAKAWFIENIIYLSLDEQVSLSLRGVKWTPDPNSVEK